MTIDWRKEVEARKEDLLSDLFTLLSVPSVRDDALATVDAPVGPGPKAALLKFLEIGKRDGFNTKNIENIAGHLEYGTGEELLGIFGHVDVVPVGTGWDTDPFKPEIKDGKIYARGASDDKGPSMGAYYGLKIIKELGLPVSKRVRFIIGTDEESGWKCMTRYMEVEEKPDFGFAPDADFPIINGEKGNTSINLVFPGTNGTNIELVSFTAGLRVNMVPESATAKVRLANGGEGFKEAFTNYLASRPITGTIEMENDIATLVIKGKSAHGASPASGVNGGTYLADFLAMFDFSEGAKGYLTAIAQLIHEDTTGKTLGIYHHDDIMGETTANAGLFHFEAGQSENVITVNIRYPKGTTATSMATVMNQLVAPFNGTTAIISERHPHYVPEDDELVKTLLTVYEEQTGLQGHGQVIGGGTFGQLLERGVAFGAMFPDSVDTMHQANEFMTVDDLINATVIYTDAIYRLIK